MNVKAGEKGSSNENKLLERGVHEHKFREKAAAMKIKS